MADNTIVPCIFDLTIQSEGVVRESFRARVLAIEDKIIKDRQSGFTGLPYIRLTLGPCEDNILTPEEISDNDGRRKITAIAVGDSYLFAKEFYMVGETYHFPADSLKAQPRNKGFRSWSTEEHTLWFLPISKMPPQMRRFLDNLTFYL